MIVRREVGRSDDQESLVWRENECSDETFEMKEK